MNLSSLISLHLLAKQREANGIPWLVRSLTCMQKKDAFTRKASFFHPFVSLSLPPHNPHGINYGQKCHAAIGENGLPKCCNAH